jgi:glycogen debranching enzyme
MAANEAYALAELADAIGRPTDATQLRARADGYASAIRAKLWDDGRGIYANLVLTNESLSNRISPTSFYPLMLGSRGKADDTRADAMMGRWLTNATRFCVGNTTDTCHWGLPSISADDDSYAALGYWRGFVWGPMAQLVHWSLQEFDHVPSVHAARQVMARQMGDMFVDMWRLHGHVCENYLPHKNGTMVDGKVWPNECTGTTFYHWGALTGLIQLVEQGP